MADEPRALAATQGPVVGGWVLAFCGVCLAIGASGMIGCSSRQQPPPPPPVVKDIPFRDDGTLTFQRTTAGEAENIKTITIEIADTDTLRMRGLMDRQSIPSDRGMLFIFPFQDMQGFWMANTQSSLDLMFVGADSVINDIAKYAKPMSPETVAGSEPAQFVVEIAAGFSDNNGIVIGDRVTWRRN